MRSSKLRLNVREVLDVIAACIAGYQVTLYSSAQYRGLTTIHS